ncbi:MAG TPA: hypothetical protein VE010_06695 [Thermoanaerobaculia bacterium]|nr:hypothetical protein [Thermoanaerobaculia bacterium]
MATLRAFADRMADEGTRAETYLTELLAGSRETWMPRLAEHPEWRTAGTVRSLIDAASRAIDTMPPDAVEMTALATEIAEHLDQTAFPSDTVSRLRGAAWRERAYALFYTGRFSDAEAAVLASERHFCSCAVNEYDLARLGIVKALVFRAFEKFDEAKDAAGTSAEAFLRFDDLERTASARMAEVHLLFSRGAFAEAAALLRPLEQRLRNSSSVETHARVLGNLGYSAWQMRDIENAVRYYDMSTALFTDLGIPTEAVRNRWNAATIVAEAGMLAVAYSRLVAVRSELELLGMTSEAALAGLEIAEVLLAENRFAEVEEICRTAMTSFQAAGLEYTTRALTALGLIREAAQQRTANKALVRQVREYVRRLPSQPNLLFAPSPFE